MKLKQMSLLGDTHASHSVSPGCAEARTMTAISGQKCYELLRLSGRDGSLAKMLLGTLAWDSTLCYLTWKVRTTPAGHLLFQLVPSTPRIDETEFSFWPTPIKSGYNSDGHLRMLAKKLTNVNEYLAMTHGTTKSKQMRFWPTIQLPDTTTGGKLNPEWVEWLMGFPAGWTDLNNLETASSLKSSLSSEK